MNEREQRGLFIAAQYKLTQKADDLWLVPSQTGSGKYTVCPKSEHCSCPDHETRNVKCKHLYAVDITIKREFVDGSTITLTARKTYAQNWPAYNAAQVNEKDKFQTLLRDLCCNLREPVQKGRPRIPLSDSIFSAVFKVYSTFSGRRFMSDLRAAQERGHINKLPCYNSIFNVLDAETTSAVLTSLVVESAKPLHAIETKFAPDSSGFSGRRFDRWYDHKFGEHKIKRSWVKAHVMTGIKTNIITAVEIHDKNAGDSPLLPTLLNTTAANFTVRAVSADMGYLSESNFSAITDAGAVPFIPFKCNSVDRDGLWSKMFHYFNLHRDTFLQHYHLRSNVESTFSMIKAKFGDSVRSKTDMAMKNEVLAKFVCHNICCLIQSMYELNVEPVFWGVAA